MTRRISLLGAVLACALTLVGCGGSDSPSSSPTPTQSFAGPTMPAQAQGGDRNGAKAFVSFWVETLNFATDSGDTEGLKALSTKECEACTGFAQTLDEIYGKGGRVDSGGWTVSAAVPIADQPENETAFQLRLELKPQKVYESKDAKPKKYPGGEQGARIILIREDDHWLVKRVDLA